MIRLLFIIVPLILSGVIYVDARKAVRPMMAFFIACAMTVSFPWGPLLYLNFRKRLMLRAAANAAIFCSKCGHSPGYKVDRCPKCDNSLSL